MGQTWSGLSIWEVRTTGSDTNGGGFVGSAGSDYTQQNSPQYSGTDLEVNSSNNLQVKSTTAGSPVAADVGNVICISAGTFWTTGWYEIQSQDGTWWTLDRSPNAAGSTGGTFAVGGALASPGLAGWIAQNYYSSNNRRGRVYIESGTYTVTNSTAGLSQKNLNGPRCMWIGYDQTYGRNSKPATNPLIQSDSSFTGRLADIGYNTNVSYVSGEITWVDFDGGSYTTDGSGVVRAPQLLYQCTVRGGVNRTYSGSHGCKTVDCQIYGTHITTYKTCVSGGYHYYSYIDGDSGGYRGRVFQADGHGCIIVGSTNGGGNNHYACAIQRQGMISNSIIVAKSSAAINPDDGTFVNNLILSTSTSNYLYSAGASGGVSTGHRFNNYHYGFNTSSGTPVYTGSATQHQNPVALSADPCVDLAGGDYTLDPSSAAFSTLRGIPDISKPYGFDGGAMVGPGVDVTTISSSGSGSGSGSSYTPAASAKFTRLE
mgnify:CR=1 FL=1